MYIGINIGTTNVSAATLDYSEMPVLVKKHFDQGKKRNSFTPAKVYIEDNFAYVGQIVNVLQKHNPSLSVAEAIIKYLGQGNTIYKDTTGQGWCATNLIALILKKIKLDAEIDSSQSVEGMLVSIPSWFNTLQKNALKEAFQRSNIKYLGWVEDYKAILAGYRLLDEPKPLKRVMIYQLGGTYFQVQLVEVEQGLTRLVWSSGQQNIGGILIDEKIVQLIQQQFQQTFGKSARDIDKNKVHFYQMAEKIKIKLTNTLVPYAKEFSVIDKKPFEVLIYQQQISEYIENIVKQTIAITLRGIKAASWSIKDIQEVLLSGSSCKLKQVQNQIGRLFSQQVTRSNDIETAKAKGTALFAYKNLKNSEKYINTTSRLAPNTIILELCHKETSTKISKKYIVQGTTLPAQHQEIFQAYKQGQEKIEINLKKINLLGDLLSETSILVIELPDRKEKIAFEIMLMQQEDGALKWTVKDIKTKALLKFNFKKSDSTVEDLQSSNEKVNSKVIKVSPKTQSKFKTIRVEPKSKKVDASEENQSKVTPKKNIKINIDAKNKKKHNSFSPLINDIIINNIT